MVNPGLGKGWMNVGEREGGRGRVAWRVDGLEEVDVKGRGMNRLFRVQYTYISHVRCCPFFMFSYKIHVLQKQYIYFPLRNWRI